MRCSRLLSLSLICLLIALISLLLLAQSNPAAIVNPLDGLPQLGGTAWSVAAAPKSSVSQASGLTFAPAVAHGSGRAHPAAAPLADGTYVFQLSGEDYNSLSPFNVVGAITIASGAITGGEQDFVDAFYGASSNQILIDSNTTITTTADGNLQIVLDTGNGNLGVGGNGLETMNVTLATPSTGLMTWFDGFAAGSGTLALQDPTAAQILPQYGYAFLTSGSDSSKYALPVVIGGILNVDDLNGTTGTISGAGSVFDISDESSATGPNPDQAFAASTVLGPAGAPDAPDSFGRVTFTLNPSAASGVPEIGLAGYIIDFNTIALVETSDGFRGITGGTALAQISSDVGNFGASNLSGSTYVVGAQGQDLNFFLDFSGALTFNSNGLVSGTATFNDQWNPSSGSITGGTYAVDPTGRVTITGLTGTNLNLGSGSATLQLYLDGNGNALVASMDLYDFTAGPAFQQTAGASISGNYALRGIGVSFLNVTFWSAAGPINIGSGVIGSGSFTDFDYFGNEPPTFADVPLTGTVSSATGTITGLGADSIASPPLESDTFNFYVIDGYRAFGIETDNAQLGLLYFQAQTGLTPTTTVLVSSPNPSSYGQTLTLSSTVTPQGKGTPTGTVSSLNGASNLGNSAVNGGVATLNTSLLAVGTHSLKASYNGGPEFSPSISSPLTQTVNQAASTTSLVSSANPIAPNQSVTYTATITSQYGGATTGTVTFNDNGRTTTVPLTGGTATLAETYPATGTHTVTATYSGDSNNTGSASGKLIEYVEKLPVDSKTVVTTSGSPSFIDQSVTFTATITSTYGRIPDGETVTFFDGTTKIGIGVTANEVATFSTSTLTARTHTIKATYAGDDSFKTSSGTVKQVVKLYPSTTTVTSSPNPSTYGEAVTLTATITSSAPSEVTGTVTFKHGSTTLGTATVSAGTSAFTTTKLPVGTVTITADYNGDAQSAKSSGTVKQVVNN